MKKDKKPFSASENHSYNVNVAVCLKHTGKATMLKEMHRSHQYWARQGKGDHDGFNWFFLRMESLSELYPEYNKKSMYRWIRDLEELYLVASRSDLNQHGYDKTRWFTVNLDAYESLTKGDASVLTHSQNENTGSFSKWANAILKMRNAIAQNEISNSQNVPTIQPLLKTSIKNLDKKKSNSDELSSVDKSDWLIQDEEDRLYIEQQFQEKEKNSAKKEKEDLLNADAIAVVQLLNELAERDFSTALTGRGSDNVKWVKSLLKQKYQREELELMVMYKVWEWKDNDKMSKHLQPVTMFKRHGKTYIEQALMARDNPAFQKAVKKAKSAESKNGTKLTGGTITRNAAESLVNW